MELRIGVPLVLSPALKQKREEEERQRNDAARKVGEFMISMTNICFNKCINLNKISLSKKEENCVNSCFNKFSDLNLYSYNKFAEIDSNIERSNDYGDYYDFLSSFFHIKSYTKYYLYSLTQNIAKT